MRVVAGFTIFLFDTVITLGDEIRYIWRSPGNVAKVAHLSNKYVGLVFLGLINLGEFLAHFGGMGG